MADLFDDITLIEKIERRALEIWQQREMGFPPRVRRMNPDDIDRVTGAWQRVLVQAALEL